MYDQLAVQDRFDPAGLVEIQHLERSTGFSLPDDFREFLGVSNGYNGEVAGHYLVLWSADELVSLGTGYDMLPPGPTQLLIGSNGGPTAFAIVGGQYVSIPFVAAGSQADEMRILGNSFAEFIDTIAQGEGW